MVLSFKLLANMQKKVLVKLDIVDGDGDVTVRVFKNKIQMIKGEN